MQYEFAILLEEELTRLEQTAFDELDTEVIVELEDLPEESAELSLDIPEVEMDFASSGAMPTLGGSGSVEDFGLARAMPTLGGSGSDEAFGLNGNGAGTSFFGVNSRGTRFAYIVDMSGSMRVGRKMTRVKRELSESIQSLPDGAQFFVILFASNITFPPDQIGWMKANKTTVTRVVQWLYNEVDPWGGTKPRSAFQVVFDLDKVGGRPDVIFFLTDGKITDLSAEEVDALNDQGKRVVINTFAFGDPVSQGLLRKIASQSGGDYRFVSARSR